jgi:hypothetical protein
VEGVTGLLLSLLFGSPWLAGSVVLWRLQPRDRPSLPSPGEVARSRF